MTVLEVGLEEANRARIFTDDAKPIELSQYEDGGDFSESRKHEGKTTGWITSALYDGTPLLRPLPPEAASDAAGPYFAEEDEAGDVVQRLRKLAATLRGICHWTNETLVKVDDGRQPMNPSQWRRIRREYAQLLGAQVDASHRVALEAQCLAVRRPGRMHLLTGLSLASWGLAFVAGRRLWLGRAAAMQPKCSTVEFF